MTMNMKYRGKCPLFYTYLPPLLTTIDIYRNINRRNVSIIPKWKKKLPIQKSYTSCLVTMTILINNDNANFLFSTVVVAVLVQSQTFVIGYTLSNFLLCTYSTVTRACTNLFASPTRIIIALIITFDWSHATGCNR